MNKRSQQCQHEFAAALQTLRILVKEVGGNYLATLQSDIARVERTLGDDTEDGGETPDRHRIADMRRMLRLIGELDLKPHKGRRRDLKALDKLIGELNDTVEEW